MVVSTSEQMALNPDDDVDLCKLYVSNIESRVEEKHLYELFLQAGPLRRVDIPSDRGGIKRNFAFVIFKHHASVAYAIKIMNKLRLFNKALELRPYQKKGAEYFNNSGLGTSAPNYPPPIIPLLPTMDLMFSAPQIPTVQRNLGFPASFPIIPKWTPAPVVPPASFIPPGTGNRGYEDSRGGYEDSRGGYEDTRGGYEDSRGGYEDSRGGYEDTRGAYNTERSHHDRSNRDSDRSSGRSGGQRESRRNYDRQYYEYHHQRHHGDEHSSSRRDRSSQRR